MKTTHHRNFCAARHNNYSHPMKRHEIENGPVSRHQAFTLIELLVVIANTFAILLQRCYCR